MCYNETNMDEEDKRYGGDGPKTGIFDSAKSDYTPDFTGDSKEKEGAAGEKNSGFFGKSALRTGENAASEDPNSQGRGGDKNASLGEKENNVPADKVNKIKNTVEGLAAAKAGNFGQAASKAKQAGPFGAILIALLGFGILSYAGESLAPFHYVANIIRGGNTSLETVINRRHDYLLRFQMAPNSRVTKYAGYDLNSIVKGSFASPKKFNVRSAQKKKLARNGITFEDIDGMEVMKYQGRTIVANADMTSKVPGSVDLNTALREGGDFSHSFIKGTATLRSSVRYWFDTKLANLLTRLHLSRSKTNNMEKGELDEVIDANDEIDTSKNKMSDETSFDTDEERGDELITTKNRGETAELDVRTGDSEDVIKTKLDNLTAAKAQKISKAASAVMNMACLAVNLASSVTSIMRVLQLDQVRQVATTFLEIIQKTQIGDEKTGALNAVAETMMKEGTNTFKTGTYDDEKTVTTKGNWMQSTLTLSLFEDKPRAPDASVDSLNPLASLGEFGKGLDQMTSSTNSFIACASMKIAAAAADAISDAYDVGATATEIAACVAGAAETFGASCAFLIAHALIEIGEQVVFSFAVTAAIQQVVSWLVPKVANMLANKLTTNLVGKLGGDATTLGALDLETNNHLAHGGTLATRQSYEAYKKVENEVIAEKAHYERQERSPFDPTSEYTFLGSLLSKFGLLANTTTSPLSALSSLGSTALSSAGELLPHASAIEAAENAEYLEKFTAKYCPNLAGIGALARDAACTKLMIEDVTTLDDDPLTNMIDVDNAVGSKNFEDEPTEEGVPVIKQDSDLMDYIIAVPNRQSEFGIADQNIANSYSVTSGVGGQIIDATPVIGGIIDVVNNEQALRHVGYVSGRAGVTGNDGTELGNLTAPWSRAKKYQRFISDQLIMEAMGVIKKSAVTAALEKYYEEHPLDNSFEGILARKTGLTKENVNVALDFIKVATFAANYEPADFAPYVQVAEEQSTISFSDDAIEEPIRSNTINIATFIVRKDYYIA